MGYALPSSSARTPRSSQPLILPSSIQRSVELGSVPTLESYREQLSRVPSTAISIAASRSFSPSGTVTATATTSQ